MDRISADFVALQTALAGEYSLERELGRGGMGIVYLAREVQLDRYVAIKVLPGELSLRPEFRERFLREARTAAGLSHPHIVPIHRVGEAAGFVFFVMSYVPGQSLGERLRSSGPLPPVAATRMLREVAWALAYAHGRGVVHRDVKPDNILLEEGTGRALVTDFGIAQVAALPPTTSDPGRIMGTAHFMSPEQGAGERLDGRTDLYSLGVVGFLAVSGRLPFESSSLPAHLVKQASETAPSLARVAPGAPPPLVAAIESCLQRDRDARVPSGEALADALAPAKDSAPALPAPLRAWLRSRNPATLAYTAWSGLFGLGVLNSLIRGAANGRLNLVGTAVLAALAAAPLVPIIGYHCSQARRLFGSGFSLGDLRTALDIARRERTEEAVFSMDDSLTPNRSRLRVATLAMASATLFGTYAATRFFMSPLGLAAVVTAWAASGLLIVANNVSEIPLLPRLARDFFKVGLRERLWRSRLGALLAGKLGAPATSGPVGAGVFRATESALGVAAAELYALLPKGDRERLSALPEVVRSLEQRAASARTQVEMLDQIAAQADPARAEVAALRAAARRQLTESVAALESIRLDLLRLHAGSIDLAPLTTLLDAARALGDDVVRLADAKRDVRLALGSPASLERREPTPV
jgi:eukaryotic-like serine/threonine-protein kinase